MHVTQSPLVTIGIPVRNGAATLDRVLSSLTQQSYPHLEIIVSDNDSPDATGTVAQSWVERDTRIRYIRQPRDIGPTANFRFVLGQARSDYFMWAAHDDFWFPDYVAENLAVLESREDVVCSVSRVELIDVASVGVPIVPGDEPLLGTPHENLIQYLREPGANSRIYGLYRTRVLQDCFHATDTYWAFDWAIVARTLVHGKHFQVPRHLMSRNARGMSSDISKCLPRFNRSWLTRRFPMLPFTWKMLTDPQLPKSFALARSLLAWNRRCFKDSMRRFRRRRIYPLLQFCGLRSAAT